MRPIDTSRGPLPIKRGAPYHLPFLDPLFAPVWPSEVWVNPQRRTSIPPTGDPVFLVALDETLVRIRGTRVGFVLLNGLKRGFTIITPQVNFRSDGFTGKADRAAFTLAINLAAATAKNEPVRDRGGPFAGEPGNPEFRGTGEGAPSVVYFDLAASQRHMVREDGVLVHELSHAIRIAFGSERARPGRTPPLPSRFHFPTSEEFFANTIMNMYLVELGRDPIIGYEKAQHGALYRRARPSGGRSSAARDAVARKLRSFEQRYLRGIVRRAPGMAGIFAELGSLPVPYNPFRDIDRPNAPVRMPMRYR